MLNVFVSHAAIDADVAGSLQGWIHSTFLGGIHVFASSDSESIRPGDDWRAVIEKELRDATIALVICTEVSLGRPWLGFEAGAAWMNRAKVVPLCYHGMDVTSLPLPFSSRQGLDLGVKSDVDNLLTLLVDAGGFDRARVERKELRLPHRRERAQASPFVDVRANAAFGWLSSGRVESGFGNPCPDIVFRIENHGNKTVYLEDGVDIFLKDGGGKYMVRAFENLPLYRRDLLPGQSETVHHPLDDLKPEDISTWDTVFFTDQIGRRYVVDPTTLDKAVAEFAAYWQSRTLEGDQG